MDDASRPRSMEQLPLPAPALGIDIDGCIDEAPAFFQILTHVWPGTVYVVSFRKDRAKTEADLHRHSIRWDRLILVESLEAKAKVIEQEDIQIFFDDQPECLKHMEAIRHVLLVRNEGNFDFEDKRWMFSEKTGKLV